MKTKVGVFFGGRSTEHEISVISANQAINAFNPEKYEIIPIYLSKEGRWYTGKDLLTLSNYKNIPALLEKCTEVYMRPVYGDFNLYNARKSLFGKEVFDTLDIAVPVLHGTNVEDGKFEGVLETIGIPYAGCDTLASANGMDKITMKMILRSEGIPVVDYVWFTDRRWNSDRDAVIKNVEETLGYPVIVKPADLGSSIGIGAAHNREELVDRVNTAARFSQRIIVEHMVTALREINCSVLGDADEFETSVLEEPVKADEILSYGDKYMAGGMHAAQKKIPAELPEDVAAECRKLAGETFRVLGCHGVSRVDLIMDDSTGKVYVNEINTIPGSLSYYLWEAAGLPFEDLMDRLVKLAIKRQRGREGKTLSFAQNIFNMGGGVKGAKGVK
ncbi:MAG: D-alanine--D-alanine ligase [Muribaculaceae bacterium]|nr:D-alanine--D-alanine ligase [Muribaculaceae bacterium]